jgi:DNA-binding response OmpR family regulator
MAPDRETSIDLSSRLRVLVVDDEYAIAFSLGKILEHAGYETEWALSGEKAIEAARRFRPDFLLTDFAMPGINGLELAVEIKTLLPACRIILLSGHELTSRSVPYATKGYNFLLLTKPVPPGELLLKMRDEVGLDEQAEQHPKILHVDDVESHRYSVTRLLQHAGFDVTGAETGAEALAEAINHPPDLVLLDINLPDMNGFDVCRQLKESPETAKVTVVHLTASSGTPEAAAKSATVGADEFLTQPFIPAELIARLRSLLQAKYLTVDREASITE